MKKKRVLSVVISLVLVLSAGTVNSYAATTSSAVTTTPAATATPAVTTPTAATTNVTFSDTKGHWAEGIIKEAAALKIVGGYPDGTFLPDNLIKREEFYKLLTNILTQTPNTSNTKIQFTDVKDYEWYVPTIKIAVAAGITSGYGDGTFGIGMMISRQEAAKVAGSVIPSKNLDASKSVESAKDKGQIASWAYNYVNLMFQKGYMKGDTEGNFRPTMALTRAEAATILLSIKKNEPVIAASGAVVPTESAITSCMKAHEGSVGVFTKGEGTQKEPYQIATEEQLNHIRMHATDGAFYILTKNIAITKDYTATPPALSSGEDWSAGNFQPIGSKDAPFKGTIDGDGYTISGLNITGKGGSSGASSKASANYTGLFGYLDKSSSITDLTIDASTFTGNQYTGAFAGYNEGTLKDCQLGSKGVVNGTTYTGGIVGSSTKALSSLRNMGTVNGQSHTGGIVGSISIAGTSLLYCQNEGTVSGGDKTGGVVGSFFSAPEDAAIIKECYNKGKVEASSYNAGGIAGLASGSNYMITIEECGNAGIVAGTGVNGGIVGVLQTNKATITKSKNTGEVNGNGAGGIVGNNQGKVTYCYNSGDVKATMDGGGITAYQQDDEGLISKCYNEGSVVSRSYAGGIIGENESRVDNCYNAGKVSGTNYIGGIAGRNIASITNVYGAGTVNGENGAGSLVGRNGGALSNSFWLDSSCSTDVGLSDSTSGLKEIRKVTQLELSGQKKIKTTNGFQMLIDIMNANNTTSTDLINKTKPTNVWKYLYNITVPAPGSSTVVSDGGGIVPPLEIPSLDDTGNAIDPSDITTKYLYPVLIN